ncbi:MAG: ABC transporter substrate-binding protein [Actinomycetota bacterium]
MLGKVAAGVVICLSLVACDGSSDDGAGFPVRRPESSPTSEAGPVIGLVGTMSGPDGWRGQDAFEGVDVAIQELNRDSRRSELPFTLVGLDDEGNGDQAAELIARLAESDRTVGIVYAGPPEGLAASEGVLAEAGIPGVLVYGDLYSARLLRPHLFQVSPPYLWQARRIADYLLNDRRYEKVGVLAEDSLMGETAISAVRSALRDERGRPPVAVTYTPLEDDLTDELNRLRRAEVEAVIFHGDPNEATALFEGVSELDATYVSTEQARTVSLSRRAGARDRRREWRPQIATFDGAISPFTDPSGGIPPGTVGSDSYARGAFYLPVPEFEQFRRSYEAWWDQAPTGWQRRSYEAASLIGWAARRTEPGDDIAATLASLEGVRFGGLDVAFGPDDHTSVIPTTVGLWVVPRSGIDVPERGELPSAMPWVPLSRGFSTGGERTDVLPQDWNHLFVGSYRPNGPAPRVGAARFGVSTTRRDPVH